MKNQKILIIGSVAVILISIIVIIYMVTNKEEKIPDYLIEGIKPIENQDILKDTTVDNLKIMNASLLTRDEISTFKAILSNETNEEIKINKLYVIFYNEVESNKNLVLQNAIVAPNDNIYINLTSEIDLSKTTKIEYVLEN